MYASPVTMIMSHASQPSACISLCDIGRKGAMPKRCAQCLRKAKIGLLCAALPVSSAAPGSQARKHRVGGGVQSGYSGSRGRLRREGARDFLAQLHAPLVEAVDVPD